MNHHPRTEKHQSRKRPPTRSRRTGKRKASRLCLTLGKTGPRRPRRPRGGNDILTTAGGFRYYPRCTSTNKIPLFLTSTGCFIKKAIFLLSYEGFSLFVYTLSTKRSTLFYSIRFDSTFWSLSTVSSFFLSLLFSLLF